MDYNSDKRELKINRKMNNLDKFVYNFVSLLEKHIGYVIVSGYVSIVSGRSRATEDVDLLIPKMSKEKFVEIFSDFLNKGYECANTSLVEEAFSMLDEHAIRFFEKGKPIPNIEFKIITNDIQKYAFENKIKLILEEKTLFISPLELQIAYKLSLVAPGEIDEISSDKDFEDAKHLYDVFRANINKDRLVYFMNYFNISEKWRALLYE